MPSDETLATLDRAACGLMQTRDDGTFRRVNAVFSTWVGRDPAELIGKRRLQDLLTVGARIFHQTHWAPLLRIQGSVSEVKLELVHADGTKIPMVLNAIRREEDGEPVHDIAAYVARDRDRYEQELVISRKRLEALVAETQRLHGLDRDRALFAEQMIGIVSHDLRNPLAAIGMAAEVLAQSGPKANDRVVPRIQRAVERATGLIADLLDFTQARVGSGLAISISRIDVHQAIAETLEDLRLVHPSRTFTQGSDGPGECELDANRLSQLVENLLSNAVAYGRTGTPITVVSSVTETTCTISVHNDGEPIAPELVPTLFEPMQRGSKEPSRSRSIGLGLYIVREIAKAHGGTASVASSADAGTTFTVVLPRWKR
ncbi:MAG: HAMP domain-containing sensor histidine kinase [Kofleriaceae bacterium]